MTRSRRQTKSGAAVALRTDVNIWVDDDGGQLPGAWSTCRAAFIQKSTSCDMTTHRPIVLSDPMEAVVSRLFCFAKHANALGSDWLCAEGCPIKS